MPIPHFIPPPMRLIGKAGALTLQIELANGGSDFARSYGGTLMIISNAQSWRGGAARGAARGRGGQGAQRWLRPGMLFACFGYDVARPCHMCDVFRRVGAPR